jgi:hypothetical protein
MAPHYVPQLGLLHTHHCGVYSFVPQYQVKEKNVNLSLCLTKQYAMKAYGGVDIKIHVILASALVGGGHKIR